MLAAEFIALVALLGGLVILIRVVWAALQRSAEHAEDKRRRRWEMQQDLKEALRSQDHKRLDDFMVVWGSEVDVVTARHVEARRAELYVEDDSEHK